MGSGAGGGNPVRELKSNAKPPPGAWVDRVGAARGTRRREGCGRVSVELEIDEGWFDQLVPKVNTLIVKTMTEVRKDAQAICPVDTGDLKESLTVVNSAPMQARITSHLPYCAAVECGFHGEEYVRAHMRQGHPVRGHIRRGNSPEQPFLRPSLWRERDLGSMP